MLLRGKRIAEHDDAVEDALTFETDVGAQRLQWADAQCYRGDSVIAYGACMSPPAAIARVPTLVACLAGCARSEPTASAAPSAPVVPTSPAVPPPTAAAAKPEGTKACSVQVTGSATAAWVGYQGEDAAKVAAASDYWATEAELRASLEWLGNALNMDKKPPEQLKKELEVNMKKDPRIAILTMTCVTADGTLTLQPSPKSKYKDVPFAPGSYVVKADPGPGEFQALVRLSDGAFYHVDAGKLTVSKFDASGVAGTVSLQASSRAGAKLDVAATLDYPATRRPTPAH
jgi:hypothetical protein